MEGSNELLAKLSQVVSALDVTSERIAGEGAALVAGNIKRNIKSVFSANQKGKLSNSIQPRPPVKIGTAWSSNVEAGVVYARIQELGGTIVPKPTNPRQLLSWLNTGGTRVFAKSVTLPPRPYFGPGMRTSAVPYRALAKELLTSMIERANGY